MPNAAWSWRCASTPCERAEASLRQSLATGFLRSARQHPERPALDVAGRIVSYAELHGLATGFASTLDAHPDGSLLTAVLAGRSVTACAGILGALLRGHGYVPLLPDFPPDRLAEMLSRAGCNAVIVDEAGLEVLGHLLERVDRDLVLWVPDGDIRTLKEQHPRHTWCTELATQAWTEPDVPMDRVAYLLFTSGSTGHPKGVMVNHHNIRHFIDVMVDRYQFVPEDRFSQTFELVFDLSLFDHFCAWEVGACVVVPSKADLITPARYLALKKLTVWFSVPSLGQLMRRLRMLRAGFYPHLRWVLFCGEALPASVASAFAEAAPNAQLENLYGPTEVTLACTLYRWDAEISPDECLNRTVPIGAAYPGLQARVIGHDGKQVAAGESGELVLWGPQVCPGYWNDPNKTAAAFVILEEFDGIHYRTGDSVVQPTAGEPLRYLGRVDHQVKIHGYRVELGEVEAAIEDVAGGQAVVIPWPLTEIGTADALTAFVLEEIKGIQDLLAARLPDYMIPKAFHVLDAFPLNANGKIDRRALAGLLNP